MELVSTIAGHVLFSSIGEELSRVKRVFDEGPEKKLDYGAEYARDVSHARQRAMQARTPSPAPAQSPSM